MNPRQRWLVVATMSLVNFLIAFDSLGVSVLLPSIAKDLSAGTTDLMLITNIYMLMLTAPLLAAGRIADVVGKKRLAMIGLAMLVIGSIAAEAAPEISILIAARGLQGLAAAILTATGLSIVSDVFDDDERGPAIGAWVAVGAIGSAAGPIVAGLTAQLLGWRWFFLLTGFVALIALIAVAIFVRDSPIQRSAKRGLALPSAALLTFGVAFVLILIFKGARMGWLSPAVVACFVVGLVLLVAFVKVERRSPDPLIERGIFRNRAYRGTAAVALVANVGFATATFFVSLYLQQVLGLRPGPAGLMFLALTIPLIIASPIAGALIKRVSLGKLMACGMVFIAVSFLVLSKLGVASAMIVVVIALVLSGIGQALAFTVSNVAGMSALPADESGSASGMINGIRQLGSLVGLAGAVALFTRLEFRATGSSVEIFVAALGPTMMVVAVISLATVVPALWVSRTLTPPDLGA
ncbi:MAG: MFS transporter [Acidimicrobiia bacterium]|nr:MFS transporter [Acidimicrobiia bacterium]